MNRCIQFFNPNTPPRSLSVFSIAVYYNLPSCVRQYVGLEIMNLDQGSSAYTGKMSILPMRGEVNDQNSPLGRD